MSTSIDVARARSETPGCERVLHFNNAGAALMPTPVIDTVMAHVEREALTGGYEAAADADEAIERVYDSAARMLGCAREDIAVIENATRAWDMAFYAIPFQSGDRILTARAEYASNYIAYLQIARKAGAVIEVVPDDEAGQLSVEALRQMADERVRLIAITHVPTNGGLVNPAAEIGVVAREVGALYLLDACQSVGQMPVDVTEIGCDVLSVTGRKFLRGPRGTGLLYVRRAILDQLEPPFLDLHAAKWAAPDRYEMRGDARRFENWESNVAAKLGLGAAIDYALDWGLEPIWARVSALADALRKALGALPGVEVRDQGVVRCGIVSFTAKGADLTALRDSLRAQNINVSVSPREYTLIDMRARELPAVLRASVHYYNTEDEIARFCETLARLLP